MAANGPHVNHEGEVIKITGRGPNDADEDDDDARSISPITIGTEWNPRPSPRRHHPDAGGDSAKILGEDSYGMNPALGVNVVVPDKSSRKKRGESRDRLAAAAGRVGKDAVASAGGGGGGGGGVAGPAKQGRRGSSSAHPLWGASGAVAAVTATNYMAGVTGGRRSSVDRSAAIDAKMAAREAARQSQAAGGRSAADIAKAAAAATSRDREKDRDSSGLLSMSRNNASASTFGDTAANGFISVHRRGSDEPYVNKEREEGTNSRRRKESGTKKPSDKMKTQGNNSISVSGFADMFNIQGKQSSGSTGRSGSRRTAGTGTDYSSLRDDINDDSSTLFGDAGTFADVKPPPPSQSAAKPAPVRPAPSEPKRGSMTAATATASARAAPAEMQHHDNASRSSFNSFASFTPSKFGGAGAGGPPVGGGKTTGLNDSYVTELNDAQRGKEYRSGNVSSGSLGSKDSAKGKYMAGSDDAIFGSGDSNGPSPAQSSTALGRQLNALPAHDTAPKEAGKYLYNKRRSGETDYATVHDRRRSSSDSSALDRRIEEALDEDEGEDAKLADAIGRALDAKERAKEATDSGDTGSSLNQPIVKEEYREYMTELAPPATEGPNQSGASASKHSLRRGSGGSGGEESRGSLSMAMEALGLDRSNSEQMGAVETADGGIPDGEGRRAATRPGAVYEHTPAPEAYHYQTLSRPQQASARSRGISSGSNNPAARSRAAVLRDMEQQERERLAQQNTGAGDTEGRPRALSEDVDLEAVLRLSAEGGASDSDAARFLEEQRAAMERFEASQRAPATNLSSVSGNDDYNIASNEYPSSTDGINTDMTTAGAGPNRPLIEISPGRFGKCCFKHVLCTLLNAKSLAFNKLPFPFLLYTFPSLS